MKQFFSTTPRVSTRNFYSVKDVQEEIKQFNLQWEVDEKKASSNNCRTAAGDVDNSKAVNWRKYVRESVINCAGTPIELDFFEKIGGGKTEYIPAKHAYFKQNGDVDHNVSAKNSVTAAGPGAPVKFTLSRSSHAAGGKAVYPSKGWEIYIYEDLQWLRILDVNTDVPYGAEVEVQPKNKKYTAKIRAGKKMLISPASQVGGYTTNGQFTGTHDTPGYIYKMTMLRLRVEWKQAVDLSKGYEDVLQFGIHFDNEGKEVDCWEYYKKIKAMEQLKYAFNLQFFTGQKLDNPDIEATISDTSYPGFDGYVPQVMNGGGIVYSYDAQYGVDPYADFGAMLLRQDSLKRHKEWTILRALPFEMGFDRNFNKTLKSEPGDVTYETFSRSGANKEDIKRMGVKSLKMWNMSLHMKDFDALSDTRSIGNGDFPHWAFMMPSHGLKDIKGRSVPPIEYFTNQGCKYDGGFEEHQYDARKEKSGAEEVGGWMAKTIGMVAHCLNDHIIMKPRRRAA